MKRNVLLVGLMCVFLSCERINKGFLVGLWELYSVKLDALEKPHGQVFLELKPNSSFAVSKISGDLVGIYQVGNRLNLISSDDKWFNTEWSVLQPDADMLILSGVADGFRGYQLKFRRIQVVPDFTEFEAEVLGVWKVYKIRQKGEIRRVSEMTFEISGDGRYQLKESGHLMEEGGLHIDSRHRKILFRENETQFRIWFYGQELRLTDDTRDIQYDMRRISRK